MNDYKNRGNIGEEMAVAYLEKKGYMIYAKNYSNRYGEIDIIAIKGEFVAFVEVKTSLKKSHYHRPSDRVNLEKKKHIVNTSEEFLKEKKWYDVFGRYDIIEVILEDNTINHFENAFYSYK